MSAGSNSGDLPTLSVGGIDTAAAAVLLSDLGGVPVADDVLDRLMRQTGGNPLALVELPGSLSPAQLTGRAAVAGRPSVDPGRAAGLLGPQPTAVRASANPADVSPPQMIRPE